MALELLPPQLLANNYVSIADVIGEVTSMFKYYAMKAYFVDIMKFKSKMMGWSPIA
jgi:hypothetical protein